MNTRIIGMAGVLGGLGLLATEVRELFESGGDPNGANIDRIDSIGYMLWGAGFALVMWALYRMEAAGHNRYARWAPLIAMAGFVVMAAGSLLDVLGLSRNIMDPFVAVAWVLILVGTLLTGILAAMARTLPGWRRFAPLLCILVIPVFFLLGSYAGPLFGISWILLGIAVATLETPAQAATPVPAAL